MYHNRFRIHLVALLLLLCMIGCSKGGGKGDLMTPEDPSGQFLNGQVSGLGYESYTWRNGTTDSNGEFIYAKGEEVTFAVGGIVLGSAEGKTNITPIDLVPQKAGGIEPEAISQEAINITRFLMSLDADGNNTNGILISQDVTKELADNTLDFSSPDFEAQASEVIIEAMYSDGDIIPEEGVLESTTAAEDYLNSAVAAIEAEEQAAAEEAAKFECSIKSPQLNVLLIQGESVSLQGYVKGGSEQYTYQWLLDGTAFSTKLNPGTSFSNLPPGTHVLQFKVVDSDGQEGIDKRYIVVEDPATFRPVPKVDEPMFVHLAYTDSTTIKAGESFHVQAHVYSGNPPFIFSWLVPTGVQYSYGEDPLDAIFTFPTPGWYTLTVYFKDTMWGSIGSDICYEKTYVTVVE